MNTRNAVYGITEQTKAHRTVVQTDRQRLPKAARNRGRHSRGQQVVRHPKVDPQREDIIIPKETALANALFELIRFHLDYPELIADK